MIDVNKFIGLTESEARILAASAGLTVVVTPVAPTMLTNSMAMNRVRFIVGDGLVRQAQIG